MREDRFLMEYVMSQTDFFWALVKFSFLGFAGGILVGLFFFLSAWRRVKWAKQQRTLDELLDALAAETGMTNEGIRGDVVKNFLTDQLVNRPSKEKDGATK